MTSGKTLKLGIDLGGTKIEGIALFESALSGTASSETGPLEEAAPRRQRGAAEVVANRRIATPRGDYQATLLAIRDLVAALMGDAGAGNGSGYHDAGATLGIGMPGSISPKTGLVQNANSTWLNGRAFDQDLKQALAGLLDGKVRCANDANCFALSEARDGAGREAATLFGVILGTGCGGGIVREGRIINGPRGIGGEWGHNPLPWPLHGPKGRAMGMGHADRLQSGSPASSSSSLARAAFPPPSSSPPPFSPPSEIPGRLCWCGRYGCMETWVSGPALAADHRAATGEDLTAEEIVRRAMAGGYGGSAGRLGPAAPAGPPGAAAQATLERHASRLARGLAMVVNLLDPEVIVLGGGLSQMPHLYERLPALMAPFIFSADTSVSIRPPRWGDASGVRGAARLWDLSGG